MEKQGKDGGERWEQSREGEKRRIFRVKEMRRGKKREERNDRR